MSIKDLYSSGFVARNQGHFAAIVRVALSDGKIVEEEKLFLQRLAKKLSIGEVAYAEILESPTNYPINPPTTYNRRLERLFDLVRIVYVDLDIKEIGQTAASEYMEHYKKEKTKDFINTYSVNFDHLDEEDREELRKSHAKFDLEVREVRSGLRTRSELTKEFDELVETYVKNDIEIANNQLKKALGYDTDIVITGFNEENGDYETE